MPQQSQHILARQLRRAETQLARYTALVAQQRPSTAWRLRTEQSEAVRYYTELIRSLRSKMR